MDVKGGKGKIMSEDIDSSAPVKKVLEELRQKNQLAYLLYSKVLRPRNILDKVNFHYMNPGHPVNKFDDDWAGELNLDYFEPFTYKSTPPKMITTLKTVHEPDPVTVLLNEKLEWRNIAMRYKHIAVHTNVMDKYEKLNEDVVHCPKHLVDMAAHLDSEPAPYFDAGHNWLYAGKGNMQLACVHGVDCLLHSCFTTVYLTAFDKTTLAINSKHIAKFDCGQGNHILETIMSPQDIIVLRTQYKIFILKLIAKEHSIKLRQLKCIKSKWIYTSVTFDTFHCNILYICTLDQKLSIVNLDRMKARTVQLEAKVASLTDNWNSVVSSHRGFYEHVGKHSISIYDKRTNHVLHVWNNLPAICDENCNGITVAEHLPGTKSLYFATNHHLFLMDLRFFGKNGPRVVQRWHHGMESPPTFLTHCAFGMDKKLFCLCSEWCEDVCVVPNYTRRINDTNSGGVTVPYRPPSIFSALHEARSNSQCMDIYNQIEHRLVTCITGNLLLERGDNYEILMHNSFGDISCHTLYPQHLEPYMVDDSAQKLVEWSEKYEEKKKTPLELSSVNNIARALKKLVKVPEDYRMQSTRSPPESKFNESEIVETFEKEEVDIGLQEVWAAVLEGGIDKAPADTDLKT